jgi:mono/diheme cytochrome c family protein
VHFTNTKAFVGKGILLGVFLVPLHPLMAEADYLRDIKPVLQARCYACHGVLKANAGLRLDTAELLRTTGDDGPVIVPGEPEKSRLLARLTIDDPHERMPLEAAPLKPAEIAAIRSWIEAGAPVPPGEKGEADPRDHWSFRRIERPPLPAGLEGGNPIDAFLSAKLRENHLQPGPESERGLLLRRLYLDLIGLPPTGAQLRDERPYEVIVDELLASPQHGERWARHWMDVWRYSDWYGLGNQLRNSQKHLWHWRDWIVESLNADKGYDRMIHEMLAADELLPGDADAVRATGFLARNYYLFNRTTWLDDTIESTGKAFLGLTLNCAKCHDHKYDPIEAVDYYNFRALFEPHQVRLDPVPGMVDFEKNGIPRAFDDHPDEPTFLHLRGDPAQPDKSVKITPAVPGIFAAFAPPIESVALPRGEWAPATRDYVRHDRLSAATEKIASAAKTLARAEADLAVAAAQVVVAETPTSSAGTWLHDDFDGPSDRWEVIGEGWKYELRFAVRDRLVKVWLDEALLLAYELPRRSEGGRIALSGFDATVAFDSFSTAPLDAGVKLTAAGKTAGTPPLDPANAVALAKASLSVAEAELAHLEAVLAADTAALTKPNGALAKIASQREGEMMAARAQLDLLTLSPDGDPKKVKAGNDALAAAEKKIAAGDSVYTPLRAAKKALESPEHKDDTYGATFSPTSTGRRLMLAKWMTSRENPLAARVAVNHVWMRHFGEPLVETVFDFGRQAPRPEHHELLDWLAAEFIESGWSFKQLHRLLVTSEAYRRGSSNADADPDTLTADPTNRFYWRAHPRRMESQVVRDSLLRLGGELDLTAGGPSVPPNGGSKRRGLYLTHSRDAEDKFLTMFDNADIFQCYRRTESIVPQQALAMANSGLSLEMAEKIAARLHADDPGGEIAFIGDVFILLLGRSPDEEEQSACLEYWHEISQLDSVKKADDPAVVIRARFVHALLNHNDFVTVR